MNPSSLGPDEILALLPYGPDFLFVNRVWDIDPGHATTTSMDYQRSHVVLRSHFRDGPAIVPGALIAEQICQSALLLGLISETIDRPNRLLLGWLQCRFYQPATADCTVHSRVELVVTMGEAIGFAGEARLQDDVIAKVRGSAKNVPAMGPADQQ